MEDQMHFLFPLCQAQCLTFVLSLSPRGSNVAAAAPTCILIHRDEGLFQWQEKRTAEKLLLGIPCRTFMSLWQK